MTTRVTRSGPPTLYADKVRSSIALQLTAELHEKLARNLARTGVRRGDFICRLIELYADTVQIDPPAGKL